jgi:hypothetical protein
MKPDHRSMPTGICCDNARSNRELDIKVEACIAGMSRIKGYSRE